MISIKNSINLWYEAYITSSKINAISRVQILNNNCEKIQTARYKGATATIVKAHKKYLRWANIYTKFPNATKKFKLILSYPRSLANHQRQDRKLRCGTYVIEGVIE